VDLSEVWARADGALERTARSWKNAEIGLLLIEDVSHPPGPEDEPPDHEITLAEINAGSRKPESPADRARREERWERYRNFSHEERGALRSAWAEFYQREGMTEHAARLRPYGR
jgi:hypothetical protein